MGPQPGRTTIPRTSKGSRIRARRARGGRSRRPRWGRTELEGEVESFRVMARSLEAQNPRPFCDHGQATVTAWDIGCPSSAPRCRSARHRCVEFAADPPRPREPQVAGSQGKRAGPSRGARGAETKGATEAGELPTREGSFRRANETSRKPPGSLRRPNEASCGEQGGLSERKLVDFSRSRASRQGRSPGRAARAAPRDKVSAPVKVLLSSAP